MLCDRSLGTWAAREAQSRHVRRLYLFTQIALETLEWCRRESIPTVLDNPNGHIRGFRQVCENESERWLGKRFFGHPTSQMVERVEREYLLADRIRVHSEWAKRSMVQRGVPEDKIHVLRQTVNLERFCPAPVRPPADGPLRICYVGALDLRKGFVYLLRAMRAVGAKHVQLRIVGATGDRHCAQLLARERAGLQVDAGPGDPLPVYQQSELCVFPTLEDGLGMVPLEAQACGLPVILTGEAGAKEYVRPGENGWIVPPGDVPALAAALAEAIERRNQLPDMGHDARRSIERSAGLAQLHELAGWFYSHTLAGVHS